MRMVKLGEIVDIKGGYAFKSSNFIKNGVPIVRIGNLNLGTVELDYNICYPKQFLEANREYEIKKDDILIAMSGATVGKVAKYPFNIPALLNQRVGKIIVNRDIADNDYVYYFVKSELFLKQVQQKAYGCAQPNVSANQISDIKIPLPNLETQHKIVQVLDKAQALIDKRKEQIKLCDELIQSLFYDMFGDPVTNPKKFVIGTIRDMVADVKYGTSKKPNDNDGEFPILRMNNITYNGYIDLTDLKYIDLNEEEREKYLVRKGDVLFNRTNSKELVGKTAVYKYDYPMAFAGYLIRVRTNKENNPEYLSAVLNSPYGKATLRGMCKNIIGMANINAEELQNIKVPLPPVELQNQFSEKVQKIEHQKQLLQQSLSLLEDNFNSLMQKAFKGELFQ